MFEEVDEVLELEYTNTKHHTTFICGQIQCESGGEGEIVARLFDRDGQPKFEMTSAAHANGKGEANTLTMPIPPGWTAKGFKMETASPLETRWAEID